MIGAPLANTLMNHYATPSGVGVWETFATLGVIYFITMMLGALGYRVPPVGWKPEGWNPPENSGKAMITTRHVHVNEAHKTPQFWLLWGVLCLNVSAGIGVIGMASPMLQEVFGGKLIGADLKLAELMADQKLQVAAIGAGFAGLLSLFNILGRIGWASCSDFLGRKMTYIIFFALGFVLYVSSPWAGGIGSVALFVAIFCVILTMYGGGFATIPAYLADMFGTQHVGAIHGRLLTAWATAGILGPVIVNYLRDYQLDHGVPANQAYNVIMYVLAALLLVGLLCNLLVRPVADKHYMSEAELEAERRISHEKAAAAAKSGARAGTGETHPVMAAIAWAGVGIPIAYGVWSTLQKAWILFN
jgi:MFS family permease